MTHILSIWIVPLLQLLSIFWNLDTHLFLQVAGVPMTVLQTSTIFEKKWLINAAAACPTMKGKENILRAQDLTL